MRQKSPISIAWFSALASAAALSWFGLAGCQRDGAKGSEASPAPSGAASAAPAPDKKKARARGPDLHDDRFDAKIAENLPKVPDPKITGPDNPGAPLDNQVFRDRVLGFARKIVAIEKEGESVACDIPVTSSKQFRAVVWGYREGVQVARGESSDASLCVALKEATRRAVAAGGGTKDALGTTRLAIELPDHGMSILEHGDKGLELDHGLVPLRSFDKALLTKRIDEGQAYLLRVLDAEHKGAHKYYYAPADTFEPELHTIYTASTGFTLLKLHAMKKDKGLLDQTKKAAEFLLSMQSRDERDHTAGGFFYTLDLKRGKPERKLVVGTASKTVFTLLELHALTKETKYMDAARKAGDWLISMQLPTGAVRASLSQHEGGPWSVQAKESTLYTGQVLSALSRLHRATKDTKYLDAAATTAMFLAQKVEKNGCYVGDEYRKPNPISSSWLVLSLLDFAKSTGDKRIEDLVFRCSRDLLGRQWKRPEDAYRHGRWKGSLSSSGTGWLAEVMSEVFMFCRDKGKENCDGYKDAVVAAVRQIMQYTYGAENDFVVKNPKAAAGGVFWSVRERYVRTDSVCHAMNAYINILPFLADGALLELPEMPLSQRLAFDADADDKNAEAEDRAGGGEGEAEDEAPMSRAEDPNEEGVRKGPRRGPLNGKPEEGPRPRLPKGLRPPGPRGPRPPGPPPEMQQ
ncbi:glycoside hydrolase family 76 protein [Polyangium sorediatum]|uniref:Glycoside hydrolase family 76 protein n=1 Tax=Polyangium sorediatum TaxID=889274 RepID=A0ABT6NNA1_9BACT|nr:glycoside hydrolase family 76 protein [Polyangium sorediatum]MDI1429783.1 glycoside hydrolase family 76 protein [Polyangium sorediatum]